MRNMIISGMLAAALGIYVGRMSVQLPVANEKLAQAVQREENTGHNLAVKAEAEAAQQDSLLSYHKEKGNDVSRTEVLLDRVMRHFDGMQPAAETTGPATAAVASSCGIERAATRRLSGQLRTALEQYGREANRANDNTRLLNECIMQLERDRVTEAAYR